MTCFEKSCLKNRDIAFPISHCRWISHSDLIRWHWQIRSCFQSKEGNFETKRKWSRLTIPPYRALVHRRARFWKQEIHPPSHLKPNCQLFLGDSQLFSYLCRIIPNNIGEDVLVNSSAYIRAYHLHCGVWRGYNEINPSSIPRFTASVRLATPNLAYKADK